MRSRGESGITEVADDIPSLDSLSFLHYNLFHVGVHRFVAETMINDNVTTVPFVKLTFHDIPNKALFLLLYLSPDKEIEYLRSTGTRNRSGSNSGKRPPGKPDTIRREKAFYVSRADSCRPESMKNAERLSLRKCKL